MEKATVKFLKNCTKITDQFKSDGLNLHIHSHLKGCISILSNQISSQDEHFYQNRHNEEKIKTKNGAIICKFCFKKGIPRLKVQRIKKKSDKRITKKAIWQCKICKKETLQREILSNRLISPISTSKKTQISDQKKDLLEQLSKKKSKKRKDMNAGLTIPTKSPKICKDKLKNLFLNDLEDNTESKLEQMLK